MLAGADKADVQHYLEGSWFSILDSDVQRSNHYLQWPRRGLYGSSKVQAGLTTHDLSRMLETLAQQASNDGIMDKQCFCHWQHWIFLLENVVGAIYILDFWNVHDKCMVVAAMTKNRLYFRAGQRNLCPLKGCWTATPISSGAHNQQSGLWEL